MNIYFDMDGVLTNFIKKCSDENCFKKNGKPYWDKIDALGTAFWTEMEWLPRSKEMFEKVRELAEQAGWTIKVLSAIHSPQGKAGKIEWCEKNLGLSKANIDIVQKKSMKALRANPQSLLIDDKEELVNNFISAGGFAIHYDGLSTSDKKIESLLKAIKELISKEKTM